MPLSNTNFQWRPNDRSATTMLRYKVEAQRWMEGLQGAASSQSRNNPWAPFILLSHILTLLLCIVIFVVLGLKYIFVFIIELLTPAKVEQPTGFEESDEPRIINYNPIAPYDPYKEEKEFYRKTSQILSEERFRNNNP